MTTTTRLSPRPPRSSEKLPASDANAQDKARTSADGLPAGDYFDESTERAPAAPATPQPAVAPYASLGLGDVDCDQPVDAAAETRLNGLADPKGEEMLKLIESAPAGADIDVHIRAQHLPLVKAALKQAASAKDAHVRFYLVEMQPGSEWCRSVREELGAANIDAMVDSKPGRIPIDTVLVNGERGLSDAFPGGPLTGQQVAKLKAKFDERFSTVIDPNGFGVKPGKIGVFTEPEAGTAQYLGELAKAKHSIVEGVYILDHPDIIDVLAERALAGVDVRLMVEANPIGGGNFKALKNLLAEKSKKLLHMKATPPKYSHGSVYHAKITVIDGDDPENAVALIRTGNDRRSSLGGHKSFYANNWDSVVVAREPEAKLDLKHIVLSPDNALPKVLEFINDPGNKRVWLSNQSLSKPKDNAQVVDALIAAHQAGKDVRILLGYRLGSDNQTPTNDAAFQALKAAGVPVAYYGDDSLRELQPGEQVDELYLHDKEMVGADKIYVGSQNFNGGGLGRNRDAGIIATRDQVENFDDAVAAWDSRWKAAQDFTARLY